MNSSSLLLICAVAQWSRPTGAWIFFSGFKAGMKDRTVLCPRSPSQLCPSKISRRPKLPSCCQTLWWSPPQMTGWEKSRFFSPRFDELRKKTVFLHMWKSIPKDIFSISGVAVRVCILLVQRQHLQVFDVDLSSSGGRKGFLFRSTQTCYAFLVFCHVCTARDQQEDIVSQKLGL